MTTADDAAFWSKTIPEPNSGCFLWLGAQVRATGFGTALVRGQQRPAHRVAWELANGRRLSSSEALRHTCDNPPCVNPLHLRVVARGGGAALPSAAPGAQLRAERRQTRSPRLQQACAQQTEPERTLAVLGALTVRLVALAAAGVFVLKGHDAAGAVLGALAVLSLFDKDPE